MSAASQAYVERLLKAKTLKELIPMPFGASYSHREIYILQGILLCRAQEHPEWKEIIGEIPTDGMFEIWMEEASCKVHQEALRQIREGKR